VLAVDEDPDAIAAATTNADRNGVGAAVECRVDDAATLDVGQVPLVVANLITAAIVGSPTDTPGTSRHRDG